MKCEVCGRYGEKRSAYRVLVWKPVENSPYGRTRSRWEDKKMGCKGLDYITVTQDRDKWQNVVNN
jgi:hypothetical protein